MVLFLALLAAQTHALGTPTSLEDWPTATPEAVVSSPDWSDYRIYPPLALEKDHEGSVTAALLVDPRGRPTECRVLVSSQSQELDSGTCALMMQMRFEGARSGSGSPISSRYIRRIGWRLTDPVLFASSRITAQLRAVENTPLGCGVVDAEGPYAAFWSSLACSALADPRYFLVNLPLDAETAVVDVRLDAGDGASLLAHDLPRGKLIAREKVSFVVNDTGDASNCQSIEAHGLGKKRDINNLSPCGRLLSSLWFAPAAEGAAPQTGTIETRIYVPESGR